MTDKHFWKYFAFFIFVTFSTLLFINNTENALSSIFKTSYVTLNIIAWVGIIGSSFYALYKIIKEHPRKK